MHRSGTGIRIARVVLITLLAAFLTGCVGKSSGGGEGEGVQSVTLSPSGDQSIDIGTIKNFTATAKNASGQTVIVTPIRFTVTSGDSNPAPLSITSTGAGCAGTWNSTGTICSPGVPGIAIVTATVAGVSSARTTVYVHQHIDSIQVSPVSAPLNDCFSQGQTGDYQAVAYDISQHDITNTVGPINWIASTANVATIGSVTGLLQNQARVTARTPGVTQLFANVAGTTSSPLQTPFTTCLVSYIRLQVEGGSGNSFTISTGSSKTIKATAVDTLGVTLASPPLVWSSSDPEVANFSSTSNTTGSNSLTARSAPGGTAVSAACAPPACNIGVLPGLPVYASNGNLPNGQPGFGVISANVTATKLPTYTAWTATTDCGNAPGCASITFAVTPGTTPIGGSATLPRTPNSMMFNEQGTRVYFGTDQGLMYLDVTASSLAVTPVSASPEPCNVSLCGKVLAISNDGNRVVVSDGKSVPHQVYIFNASSTAAPPVDLILPSGTAPAAAFSADEMKIFLVTDAGVLYVYSAVDALGAVPISTSATDVAFSADGSIAYVAGDPAASISGFSTCSLPGTPAVHLGNGLTTSAPLRIFPLPEVQANGPPLVTNEGPNDNAPSLIQNILALEPPNIEILTTEFTQAPSKIGTSQLTCNPPHVSSPFFPSRSSFNLGQGNFTPLYIRVVGNGSQAIVVADKIPAVLVVDLNQQTTTPIPLVNNGLPLAASASTDGSQVFVAACDVYTNNDPTQCTSGSVHIVNTLSGGDVQQVPYENLSTNNSMCTQANAPTCLPNLIAVRPQ